VATRSARAGPAGLAPVSDSGNTTKNWLNSPHQKRSYAASQIRFARFPIWLTWSSITSASNHVSHARESVYILSSTA
jgi:hypothetical protein